MQRLFLFPFCLAEPPPQLHAVVALAAVAGLRGGGECEFEGAAGEGGLGVVAVEDGATEMRTAVLSFGLLGGGRTWTTNDWIWTRMVWQDLQTRFDASLIESD